MRKEDALVDLEENGLAINYIEGGTVGKLHLLEGAFFGEDLIDVGGQERVCLEKVSTQGALDGGFKFGFRSAGETAQLERFC